MHSVRSVIRFSDPTNNFFIVIIFAMSISNFRIKKSSFKVIIKNLGRRKSNEG